MLKKSLILVAVLGLFGLISLAVAQPVQLRQSPGNQSSGFQSTQQSNPTFSNANQSLSFNRNTKANNSPAELAGGWVLRMQTGEIIGADLESFQVKLSTNYGTLEIDSSEIVSLRFLNDNVMPGEFGEGDLDADDDKASKIVIATVAGDIISGESEIQSVKMKLDWGIGEANASSIDFISNRKYGVITIVNNQSTPSFVLSPVQMVRHTTHIAEHTRSAQIVTPGRLTQPQAPKLRSRK